MNVHSYEKPKMKFVFLRNEEAVANTCWGHHSSGKTLYCDLPGTGFASFQIANGSCSLNLIHVMYYGQDTDQDGSITSNDTPVPANEAQIAQLKSILEQAGGNSGNPFNGEGTIVTEKPQPSWS